MTDRPRHDPASVAGLCFVLAAGMFLAAWVVDRVLLHRERMATPPAVRADDHRPALVQQDDDTGIYFSGTNVPWTPPAHAQECPCRFCGGEQSQGASRVEWDTPPTGVYVRDGDRWVRWEDRGW